MSMLYIKVCAMEARVLQSLDPKIPPQQRIEPKSGQFLDALINIDQIRSIDPDGKGHTYVHLGEAGQRCTMYTLEEWASMIKQARRGIDGITNLNQSMLRTTASDKLKSAGGELGGS